MVFLREPSGPWWFPLSVLNLFFPQIVTDDLDSAQKME